MHGVGVALLRGLIVQAWWPMCTEKAVVSGYKAVQPIWVNNPAL